MAKRRIYTIEDAVLRKRSNEVVEFDDKLRELVDDMFETMMAADGVGIAAPQVGILKRVIVVSVDEGKNVYAVINPEIIKSSGRREGVEGCLSVPNVHENVERPRHVVVKGQDVHGNVIEIKASNLLATAFCHEIDHLNGILFIDRVKKKQE